MKSNSVGAMVFLPLSRSDSNRLPSHSVLPDASRQGIREYSSLTICLSV
jgi:hypothetical protein